MNYCRLGSSGLKVSKLGLGTNAFGKRADQETSTRIIDHALDHGINFIDTANIYAGSESERIIGQALSGKRHNVVLATKAGLVNGQGPNERGSSRYHLLQELENSLKRLKTDYVDLYQIHTFDPHTPLEETLRTLDDLMSSGKVRYIGASNYAAWEIMKALGISELKGYARYVSTQTSYSLADRTPELELVPLCLDQGVGIIPYFPLAGGILTGKYSQGSSTPSGSRAETDPNFNRFLEDHNLKLGQQVSQLAAEHGQSPSALSLAWLMNRPAVSTVIVGATKTEQLDDNLKSLEIEIDETLGSSLDEVSNGFVYAKPFATYRLG
ncbi:aldo/keto reductase [Paenibacillus vortex V453]|jgi:aryl-alcohol dehydrogenase-like predicted oxidoreductase|uniref:Aldo/keto reductase n=1 Tax=Paenibacillus vortex V453 TaxID=715225 RepID=A0A2R9SXY6_9BACL|nr:MULTISPECIES: aldo/keto reductase [Paenibacillus]ANA81121.1 aldo/keto reductase [Paenibacillus glucanolyticus]AVV54760.1 aldo/keto reductase [Paenibacillus glucanolyticus]EFU42193.1 aldo/keto reductase [Paenibacillus vortex V453]ETT33710.1 aldo/keto reductase [Paenibacillus sp. FSL R5-808]MPY18958.1 aldo/keto reductase [Paenibacillus glucanolyticus]